MPKELYSQGVTIFPTEHDVYNKLNYLVADLVHRLMCEDFYIKPGEWLVQLKLESDPREIRARVATNEIQGLVLPIINHPFKATLLHPGCDTLVVRNNYVDTCGLLQSSPVHLLSKESFEETDERTSRD